MMINPIFLSHDKFATVLPGLRMLIKHEIGDLNITIYDFAKGAILPMHAHEEDLNHITIVTSGELAVHGPGFVLTELLPGDVVDWLPNEPHEFKALTPSRIVQIRRKGGMHLMDEQIHKMFAQLLANERP